ncbi:hypothetical protein G9A89_009401 [Geosiphon pyriformis]|nr:hypothetical protein G9A89_009401 [Geosiphon pyriformis]
MQTGYEAYRNIFEGRSEIQTQTALNVVQPNSEEHQKIILGILYALFVENDDAHFNNLVVCVRGTFSYAIGRLNLLSRTRIFKSYTLYSLKRFLWIVEKLIELDVNEVATVCENLLKQIRGSHYSLLNLLLCETMVQILSNPAHSRLTQMALYTFLRTLRDHFSPNYQRLADLESNFCLKLLTEQYSVCQIVGRDLLRLLIDVARHPKISRFLKDFIHDPIKISPTCPGLVSLVRTPTPQFLTQSRLTFDMDFILNFMFNNDTAQGYSARLNWLLSEYLPKESEYLVVDVIRYICCNIHPTNEVLKSTLVKRYVVLIKLLQWIQDPLTASQAKLALFYDWLFWQPNDNIMKIEPAILVIVESTTDPAGSILSASLVEFLRYQISVFCKPISEKIRKSVQLAMDAILDRGVLYPTALSDFIKTDKIHEDTREYIKEMWHQRVQTVDISTTNSSQTTAIQPARPAISVLRSTNIMPDSPIATTPTIMSLPPVIPQIPTATVKLESTPTVSRTSENFSSLPETDKEIIQDDISRNVKDDISMTESSFEPNKRTEPKINGHNITDMSIPFVEFGLPAPKEKVPQNLPDVTDLLMSKDQQSSALVNSFKPKNGIGSSQTKKTNVFWLYGNRLEDFKTTTDQGELKRLLGEILDVFRKQGGGNGPREVARVIAPIIRKSFETSGSEKELFPTQNGTDSLFDIVLECFWKWYSEKGNEVNKIKIAELMIEIGEVDSAQDFVRTRILLLGLRGSEELNSDKTMFASEQINIYKQFVKDQVEKGKIEYENVFSEIKTRILRDMALLQKQELPLFHTALLSILRDLREFCVGNVEFIYLTISRISSSLAFILKTNLSLKTVHLFGDCNFDEILVFALGWTEFEQITFFILLNAEMGGRLDQVERFFRTSMILRGLNGLDNPEAFNGLSTLLGTVPPTASFLSVLSFLIYDQKRSDSVKENVDFVISVCDLWRRRATHEFFNILVGYLEWVLIRLEETYEKAKKENYIVDEIKTEANGLYFMMKEWWEFAENQNQSDIIRFILNRRIFAQLKMLTNKLGFGDYCPQNWWSSQPYEDLESKEITNDHISESANGTTNKDSHISLNSQPQKGGKQVVQLDEVQSEDDNQAEIKNRKPNINRRTTRSSTKRTVDTTKKQFSVEKNNWKKLVDSKSEDEDEEMEDKSDEEQEGEDEQEEIIPRKRNTRSQAKKELPKRPATRSKKIIISSDEKSEQELDSSEDSQDSSSEEPTIKKEKNIRRGKKPAPPQRSKKTTRSTTAAATATSSRRNHSAVGSSSVTTATNNNGVNRKKRVIHSDDGIDDEE